MKRKIYDKMLEWKKTNGKSALFIDGPRRVGKSYIALEFGKREYKSYVFIDFFQTSEEVTSLFSSLKSDLDTLFLTLSLIYNTNLYERDTLFIFDEIEFCPAARSLIKYLVADGRFDYLETGSLVSIKANVKNILIPSEETHIYLYPLDFEEFLWAMSNIITFPYIKKAFNKLEVIPDAIHRKIMTLFRTYLIVGGMPQAVLSYLDNKDDFNFNEVEKVKQNILTLYRNDMRKYSYGLERKIEDLFNGIPSELSKHEKKYNLSNINKDARYRTYEDAIFWLVDAGLINITYNVTEPNIGFKLSEARNTFKAYLFDTGLLLSLTFGSNLDNINEIYKKIILNKLDFNNGMILENMVAQILKSTGHNLNFFSKYAREAASRMEIDFVINKRDITNKHNITAIEVKSGKRYTYNSLNKFKAKYSEYLDKMVIIHTDNLKVENNILFIPIYMTYFL